MSFTHLQTLVAKHYEGGEYAHITDIAGLSRCGDTLFEFVVLEAGDASGREEFCQMLDTAIAQLSSLQASIEDESA